VSGRVGAAGSIGGDQALPPGPPGTPPAAPGIPPDAPGAIQEPGDQKRRSGGRPGRSGEVGGRPASGGRRSAAERACDELARVVSEAATEEHPVVRSGRWLYAELMAEQDRRRPAWFRALPPEDQDLLLAYLAHKGFASAAVADRLGVSRARVGEVATRFYQAVGTAALGVTLPELVGRLKARAEMLAEKLILSGDYRGAWRLELEHLRALQDLGVVERAAQRHEHLLREAPAATEDGAAKSAELGRIIDLERRRRESAERAGRLRVLVEEGGLALSDPPPEERDNGGPSRTKGSG